jgi:transposase
MNLNAAGIAVGSAEHHVAVPIGRDPHPVQKFGSFTAELYRMVKWVLDWGVKSVGIPASSVYWIGLYPILEEHGLEVRVTNARYTQRLPGGKSNVQEYQGLQKLDSFGLLPRCFRPTEEFRVLRSYLRQRENLVAGIGICMQLIPKALPEKNRQRTNVLPDIRGKSAMAILRAIVAGERDPYPRAELCAHRVRRLPRASRGLRPQDRSPPADHRPQTGPCPACAAPTPPLGNAALRKPIPHSTFRTPLSQVPGVDLTQIDGMGMQTAEVLRSEVGADMSKGENGKTFCFLVGGSVPTIRSPVAR